MKYEFRPNYKVIGRTNGLASIKDLEAEVSVYSATPEFVREHCGPIANKLMDQVPYWYFAEAKDLGLFTNVDVRVHRLYPGDFPAYPGWHCDGEYRETYFSQPDMNRIKVSKNITCTISSHENGVSNTQFLDEPFNFETDDISTEHTLWGQVHDAISRKKEIHVYDSDDGELILFDNWSLHRAMPTKIRGWRLFFRMSMWHKPNLGDGGMISKQEQVYKIVEGDGW